MRRELKSNGDSENRGGGKEMKMVVNDRRRLKDKPEKGLGWRSEGAGKRKQANLREREKHRI
jgi:hypothetical protein